MYKARPLLWIGIVAVLFGFLQLEAYVSNAYNEYAEEQRLKQENAQEITIGLDINDSFLLTNFKTILNNNFGFGTVTYDSQGEFLLSNNNTVEGYTDTGLNVYSPLVLAFYTKSVYEADKKDDILMPIEPMSNGSGYCRGINFKTLIEAVECNKKYESIGMTESALKSENIRIIIPSKESVLYKYTEDLFYVTFNDGKAVTEEDKEELKERVSYAMSKCETSDNIYSVIINMTDNSASHKDAAFVIMPEYYASLEKFSYKKGNYENNLLVIYPNNTVAINFHLFEKNGAKHESFEYNGVKYASKAELLTSKETSQIFSIFPFMLRVDSYESFGNIKSMIVNNPNIVQ